MTAILRWVTVASLVTIPVLLSGCAAPEARDWMVIDEDRSSCVTLPGDRTLLQVPLSLPERDLRPVRIGHLDLLEAEDLDIVGFVLSPANADQHEDQSPPPADLIRAIEQRGQNVQPVQQLTERGERLLTVLLESSSNASRASAGGIRIQWNIGEPLFFQDTTASIRIEANACQLG